MAFDTELPVAPFSVAGTGFLVGFRNRIYVVTAGHVVGDLSYSRVLIYPTHRTNAPLRLDMGWRFQGEPEHDDAADIFIARADASGLGGGTRRRSRLLNLTPPQMSHWSAGRHTSTYFAAGYPKTDTYADYDRQQLKYRPFLLYGNYINPGSVEGCHKLKFQNPHRLPSFDGLSGSPVFSIPTNIGIGSQPKFCGMLIRGTASSGIVHLLEAEVLLVALEEVARDA